MNVQHQIDKFLLVLGSITGGAGLLANADMILAILLKITSLCTFFCFIAMNHEKIKEGVKSFWKKYL